MTISGFQDLIVWQKAMGLATAIFELTKKLPKEEIYALSNQMRRAAVSIPSNIAEGHERNSTREYVRFLAIAKGSKAELETQLRICVKVGYFSNTDILEAMNLLHEITKMLSTLIKKLGTRS
jgi:four helix bundle protein